MKGFLEKLGLAPAMTEAASPGRLDDLEIRLAKLGEERARTVAALAALLARVAFADEDISEDEAQRIAGILESKAGLSGDEARATADIARHRTVSLGREGSHEITRWFSDRASLAEKKSLIVSLYSVATADDLVTHVEDREIRSIASALLIPSRDVLEIRSRYRDKLEEIRELRKLRED